MIIYKKFDKFNEEKKALTKEIEHFLKIKGCSINIYYVYHFKNMNGLEQIKNEIFDFRIGELVDLPDKGKILKIVDHRGQYNQKEAETNKFIKNILGIDNEVIISKYYQLIGVDDKEFNRIDRYLINLVIEEYEEDIKFSWEKSDDEEIERILDFNKIKEEELVEFTKNFSMDLDDMKFIQDYFKSEKRNPNYLELKIIDTYWSDHCRHTTFLTKINKITVKNGDLRDTILNSLEEYKKSREYVYGPNPNKAISLMDLATINMKELKKRGILNNIEKSNEVNACSVEVDIMVDGKEETWLHMFKNETHNHPTEIEPYGGAHTCMGGAIRDPLSGRAKVFQSMRISGAANVFDPFENTLEEKISQRQISLGALKGFSDYANQIGIPSGYSEEYYHPGFLAKRMEVGALVAASPKDSILREEAEDGDIILLIGGETGRDGLGAAVGSSFIQTEETLKKAGTQVQRGNPYEERKIIRLFGKRKVQRLIKKSNDFGAGGVAVAIGELADGLEINLDNVFTKYPGLNAYELALSESQERMAVVIDPCHEDEFISYCLEENLRCEKVAIVNNSNRMIIKYKNKIVVDLSRDFLNSNGADKFIDAKIIESQSIAFDNLNQKYNYMVGKAMSEKFDDSNGSNTVLLEYGGKYKETKQLGMAAKFPHPNTNSVSIMTHGYYPEISEKSPYMMAYLGVLESVTRNIAMGSKREDIRLSLQEYFPTIADDPIRFGRALAALLGAFQIMKDLEIGAIGGKDSMSGTYKNIDVPPSLISFAVSHTTLENVISRELKKEKGLIYLSKVKNENNIIDSNSYKNIMDEYSLLVKRGIVLASSTISIKGLSHSIDEMSLGNKVIYYLDKSMSRVFYPGNIVFQVKEEYKDRINTEYFHLVGSTENNEQSDYQEDMIMSKSIYESIIHEQSLDDNLDKDFNSIDLDGGGQLYDKSKLENNKVVIPILDGAIGEEDLERQFTSFGFEVIKYVVKDNSHEDYIKSLIELAQLIDQSSIVAIAHGYYGGASIKNFSGTMSKLLIEREISVSLDRLKDRKGLLLGFGAGFSALIDSEKFGPISEDIFFIDNENQSYISAFNDIKVIKDSNFTRKGYDYTAPISGENISLYTSNLKELEKKVNILTIKKNNLLANSSIVDSIESKDGLVFGSHSLIERMDPSLYINIEKKGYPEHFKLISKKLI